MTAINNRAGVNNSNIRVVLSVRGLHHTVKQAKGQLELRVSRVRSKVVLDPSPGDVDEPEVRRAFPLLFALRVIEHTLDKADCMFF